MPRSRMQNIARSARTVTSTVAALNSLHKAGKISLGFLKKALGYSAPAQRKIVARYSKSGKSDYEINKLRKKVNEISKSLKHDMSHRTLRERSTGVVGALTNVASTMTTITGCIPSTLETCLTNMRWWSEATGAYVDASPLTGAAIDIKFVKVYSNLLVRNNYQSPCEVFIYCVVPKVDTSISPSTAYTNGLTDQDAPSATNCLLFLSDSDEFKKLYKIEKSYHRYLDAGRQVSFSYAVKKPFYYDPSHYDDQSDTYQPSYGTHLWVVRTVGVLGHDTVAQEFGTLNSGVDYMCDRTVVCEYDSGGPGLNDIAVNNASSGFSNSAVFCSKPVADVITYSAT